MKQNRRICFLCRAVDEFGQSQFSARRAQNREKPTGIFTLRRATAEFDETNFRNALWRLVGGRRGYGLHEVSGIVGCLTIRIACKTEKAGLKVFQSRKKIAILQI